MVIIRDRPRLPVVNSKYLFQRLIDLYQADLLRDVGSFDCAHALMFARPGMKVVALEANPGCAESMANDPAVGDAEIEVLALAAWNKDEETTFNVIEFSADGAPAWKNKLSSIRVRADNSYTSYEVKVRAVRLDSVVSGRIAPAPSSIALWIDVEGVGYEVLEGIAGIRDVVSVIHIEVETTAFWVGQRLWPDILALMHDFGFSAVARSHAGMQCNVIFISNTFRDKATFDVRWLILLAWASRRAGSARSRIRQVLWRH